MNRKWYSAEVRGIGDANRRRTFCISTDMPDRDGDTLSAAGWQLANYRKNPVVLFGHDYRSLPIAKTVDIGVRGGRLVATAEFADHDFANTVLRLIDGGFLRATSVGFRPEKYVRNETRGGVDFTQQELLEFSVVPVPANPEALQMFAVKGIKAWDDEIVLHLSDNDDSVIDLIDDDEATWDDVAQALPAALSGVLGDWRAEHHRVAGRDRSDVDASDIRLALQAAIREGLGEVISREVRSTLNRLTGRLD